jgi:hypothetical protein
MHRVRRRVVVYLAPLTLAIGGAVLAVQIVEPASRAWAEPERLLPLGVGVVRTDTTSRWTDPTERIGAAQVWERADELRARARAAAEQAWAKRDRAGTLGSAVGAGAAAGYFIHADTGTVAALGERADELVRSTLRSLVPDGIPATTVIVVLANAGRVRDPARTFLPSSPSEPCIHILRLSSEGDLLGRAQRGRLLGPCAWFAAFGMPGAPMEANLRRTRFLHAHRAPDFTLPLGTDRLRQNARRYSLISAIHFTAGSFGCASGVTSCLAMLDAPVPEAALLDTAQTVTAGLSLRGQFHVPAFSFIRERDGGEFLATLCEVVGRETCGEIWRGDREPVTAFAAATDSAALEEGLRLHQGFPGAMLAMPDPARRHVTSAAATVLILIMTGLTVLVALQREAA